MYTLFFIQVTQANSNHCDSYNFYSGAVCRHVGSSCFKIYKGKAIILNNSESSKITYGGHLCDHAHKGTTEPWFFKDVMPLMINFQLGIFIKVQICPSPHKTHIGHILLK